MDYEISFLAHDLFPEPLLMRFKLPNLVYRQCLNIFNRSYARMDKIISLGRDMTDVLREKTMPYNPNLEIIQIEIGETLIVFTLWILTQIQIR